MGSIDLQLIGGSTTRNITLQNVHYSPQAQANLLSVAQLTEVEFSFSKGFATGLFRNKEVFTGLYSRGAYRLKIEKGVCGKAYFSGPTTPASQGSLHLWHLRLGHLNYPAVRKISQEVDGIPTFPKESTETAPFCESCTVAKMARKISRTPAQHATLKLERIHSALGSIPTPSLGKAFYYVTFIDDYSRFC